MVRRNDECHLLTRSTRLSRLGDKSTSSRNEKEEEEEEEKEKEKEEEKVAVEWKGSLKVIAQSSMQRIDERTRMDAQFDKFIEKEVLVERGGVGDSRGAVAGVVDGAGAAVACGASLARLQNSNGTSGIRILNHDRYRVGNRRRGSTERGGGGG
ncbi:hypothetical protein M0804_002392 [Polistes exclamans]|nr:hypothetical protein M0804_002392 [Polistes exclamans]